MSTLNTPLRGHEDVGPPGVYKCFYCLEIEFRKSFTNKSKCWCGCVKVLLVAGILLRNGHLAHPELHNGVIKLDHLCADITSGAEMEKLSLPKYQQVYR